jgi:hypothetical protein
MELARLENSGETLSREKGGEFTSNLTSGVFRLSADQRRITQVLDNLLGNALKFTPAGGAIVINVHVYKDRDEAEISVADTGPGIPLEALQRIFEPYWRVQKTRSGMGLGLFIAKTIVESHEGGIWVEVPSAKVQLSISHCPRATHPHHLKAYDRCRDRVAIGGCSMKDERTITQFARVPGQRLWWSAIFGGTFFALGIMLVLGLFGVAVGAAASGAQGVSQGVKIWAGISSLVTLFFGFLAGGWLSSRASGVVSRFDGRMHGLVVWGLGSVALFYFAVTSTTQLGAILANLIALSPGFVRNVTATAAAWMVIGTICGLIGAIVGGHAGAYGTGEIVTGARRAA